MIYPRRFREEVTYASEEFGVPAGVIYAVIRTESGFDPAARSRAGAVGLMQLLPATFAELTAMTGENIPLSSLADPLVNIRYGTMYLSFLYREFGEWRLAYMAYNAGPGIVRKWITEGRTDAAPYPETEKYLARVSYAAGEYKRLYGI